MLTVENVTVRYGALVAIDNVSLEVSGARRVHAIIGPNGAGKSTLMDAIVGKRLPSSGRIIYRGEDITNKSPAWRRRNGMARSFQRTSIFPGLTIREQLNLVAEQLGDQRVGDIIEVMELGDVLDAIAGKTAYGVQRRVDIALGLIGNPSLLLLDEPGAGLSAHETVALFQHLRTLVKERNMEAVVVEHDVEAVFQMSDLITVLDLGRHLATGSPEEVRANPAVIKAYLGSEQ